MVGGGTIMECYELGPRGAYLSIYFEILFEDLDKCEKFCEILKNNGFEE